MLYYMVRKATRTKKDYMGRLEIRAPTDMIERVDAWRVDQPGRPSRSQAVRHLIDLALDAEEMRTKAKK